MKRNRPSGLPPKPGPAKDEPAPPPPGIPIFLLIAVALVSLTIAGGIYFLINAPSIEFICRQMGNCQKFKDDAAKSKESLNKAENSFKSTKSLSELEAASKSLSETKALLSSIPDNANELATMIVEQRDRAAELDKKIAVLLIIEQNAAKTLKEAIAKIATADELDQKPQGPTELPENAKSRLAKPKTLYVEAQGLLQSIPDNSFVATSKQEKLKQVIDKIKGLDGKIGAVAAIDPCVLNSALCQPQPVTNTSEPERNTNYGVEKPTLFGPGSPGYGR